jgi:serine phosphatase RsbU (regulator of sigma subunit)
MPLIGTPGRHVAIELRGKRLVDRFRVDSSTIYTDLSRRTALATSRADRAIVLIGVFAAVGVVLVLVASLALIAQRRHVQAQLARQRALVERERQHSVEARAAYDAEKRLADTMQEALLQRDFPELPTMSFSAAYIPATEESRIGGDWYDALLLPEGRVLLAIGDVTGHGAEAVVAMNRARQVLTHSALIDADPAAVLRRSNLELIALGSPIITAISAVVDASAFEFAYAVAGHPPPILCEPGQRAKLLTPGSLPLGVSRATSYQTNIVHTVPGAMFVLYTDGATEYSRDILAGEAALLEAVESAVTQPRGQAANAIRERIFNFEQIADDVAILTIRLWEKPQQRSLEALAERTGSRAARKTEQFQRAAPKAFRRTA